MINAVRQRMREKKKKLICSKINLNQKTKIVELESYNGDDDNQFQLNLLL